MKAYILTIVALSALTGGCFYLAQGKKFEKHIQYLGTLVLLIALISPLPKLFSTELSDLLSFEDHTADINDGQYVNALKKESEQRLGKEFSALIARKCRLSEKDFTVRITLSYENKEFDIDMVSVTLNSFHAVTQRENIRKILEEYTENILFDESLT